MRTPTIWSAFWPSLAATEPNHQGWSHTGGTVLCPSFNGNSLSLTYVAQNIWREWKECMNILKKVEHVICLSPPISQPHCRECVCVLSASPLWSVHRSQGSSTSADEGQLCEEHHVGSDLMTIRWSKLKHKDAICARVWVCVCVCALTFYRIFHSSF